MRAQHDQEPADLPFGREELQALLTSLEICDDASRESLSNGRERLDVCRDVSVSFDSRLKSNLTSGLPQLLMGAVRFGSQVGGAHHNQVVELVLSASVALDLELRAIIEALCVAEHEATVPGSDYHSLASPLTFRLPDSLFQLLQVL